MKMIRLLERRNNEGIAGKLSLIKAFNYTMSTREMCADGKVGNSSHLIDYQIVIPILCLLQILLLVHSICHWKQLIKPALFIILQIALIIWDSSAIVKGIAAKYYPHWSYNHYFCDYTSFNGRILVPITSVLIITLLLQKLKFTFEDSAYAFTQKSYRIISTALYIITSLSIIGYIFTSKPPCIYEIYAWDINETVFMCVAFAEGIARYCLLCSFFVFLVGVLCAGLSFVYKLHKILKTIHAENSQRMQYVMIKNTILTVTACISTLISYALWTMDLFNINFIIHLDAFINCLCIAFMYRHNEKYFVCFYIPICSKLTRKNKKRCIIWKKVTKGLCHLNSIPGGLFWSFDRREGAFRPAKLKHSYNLFNMLK